MTDDLVQRIRAEADMASRAGQAAALYKIADDLAARNAGAEVDREAVLKRHTPVTLIDDHEGTPLAACSHDGDDWPCDAYRLAARGDAATPGVAGEQVARRIEAFWDTWSPDSVTTRRALSEAARIAREVTP